VAVFIDLENLALGAGENLPGQADPIAHKALELSSGEGELQVRNPDERSPRQGSAQRLPTRPSLPRWLGAGQSPRPNHDDNGTLLRLGSDV
jgi:hypothetical protein